MSQNPEELSEDVNRICDVVRGTQKVVIVVGRSGVDDLPDRVTTEQLLKEWGTRMWCWPEVLLGPAHENVVVYTRSVKPRTPLLISKLNFAEQVWTDGAIARQLVDHYENTLSLSRLELVVLALECLKSRVEKGTTKFLEGDLSYALMTLLRQRPRVERQDTAFQAIARLSLANDSDRLMERMICLLPTSTFGEQTRNDEEYRRHYWTNMTDTWNCHLWDIEPHVQVAGVAENDTVILDGAHGATVTWDSFQKVPVVTKATWSRALGRSSVRATPMWFLLGVVLLFIGSSSKSALLIVIGVFFLLISVVLIFLSPILILYIYSGKVWNAQPWLFGFEG